jgi:hypothetical protein
MPATIFLANKLDVHRAAEQSVQWMVGILGFDKHFSCYGFILLSGIIQARPATTNANRWASSSIMGNQH